MILLFVDDRSERAALAYHRMSPDHQDRTIWCKAISEAISTIYDYKDEIECVMIEHDFGGNFQNSKSDKSGHELVRWLERLSKVEPEVFEKLKKVNFVIHTWNITAGKKMLDRMIKLDLNVKFHPFGS